MSTRRVVITMAAHVPTLSLNTGYKMPVLGMGTFNTLKKEGVAEAVRVAVDCGYRLFDNAWVYRSEDVVGEGLADAIKRGVVKREDLFIATKLWNTFHEPERVEQGLKESMGDLQVDYVDLFYIHWPMAFKEPEDKHQWIMKSDNVEPANVDYVDTYKAMERLVDKGLVRSLGVSNFNISQLKRLLSADLKYKPTNMQIELHPYFNNTELLNYCRDNNITVTGYSPLAKGGQEYAGKATPKLLEEDVMVDIAKKYNKTTAQVALRWGLQRGYGLVPKSVTPHRIVENFQVFDFELTAGEMETITGLNKDLRLVTLDKFKAFPEYPF